MRGGALIGAMLGWILVVGGAKGGDAGDGGRPPPPQLYAGEGDWVVVSGVGADVLLSTIGAWHCVADARWVGRIAEGKETVRFGSFQWPVAMAKPLPASPVRLPAKRNPFGACIVHSVSVRFDSMMKNRGWSLRYPKEDEAGAFAWFKDAKGDPLRMAMEVEDAESGEKWTLTPERIAQEGGVYAWFRGSARAYAGTLDNGKVDWLIATEKKTDGQWILQGRLLLMEKGTRFFRLRVRIPNTPGALPVAQDETEQAPGVATRRASGAAVALLADLSEPRQMRALCGAGENDMALEMDMVTTSATKNFPGRAAFSLLLETWESSPEETIQTEATARLPRYGTATNAPALTAADATAIRKALQRPAVLEISPLTGMFEDAMSVQTYVQTRASSLFPDGEAFASAWPCLAQETNGMPMFAIESHDVRGFVNVDPDFQTPLSAGMNRGQWAREQAMAGGDWVCVEVIRAPGLDYQPQALAWCDYPAVWQSPLMRPAVDLAHAQAEWLAAMACLLHAEGRRLCVRDEGPDAPFCTSQADALLCASTEPGVLRRMRGLAGPRPVIWSEALARAEGSHSEAIAVAKQLACELSFVIDEE